MNFLSLTVETEFISGDPGEIQKSLQCSITTLNLTYKYGNFDKQPCEGSTRLSI
jgi:hypothetical protein